NQEKSKIRQLHTEGKAAREDLLDAEAASYHSPGTCTFYGTANSNQMLMEVMGLHLPGSAFVNPNTPLRDALTIAAAQRALAITALGNEYTPVASILDERAFVNGTADVNHFTAAGGTGFLIGSLLQTGLLHPDAKTVAGHDLAFYAQEPYLEEGKLAFRPSPSLSRDES